VSQIFNLGLCKDTFTKFDKQLMVHQGLNTCCRCCTCCSNVLLYIKMSSMNIKMSFLIKGVKIEFMKHWKVAGHWLAQRA
jgi:hypothetical protein